ncbi:hypothetical protein HY411_01480 [Candidatus Gottesmanbacteria bacterium]|nr:hypothetical protein [Candidatus Gottesmanbacteria bacterium]
MTVTDKIEARRVLGAKDHSEFKDPDAIEELEEEGFQFYSSLDRLVAAEQRAKRREMGYGQVTRTKVPDKVVKQALRDSAGQ